MKINLRNQYLSLPRYNRYLQVTHNNINQANRLYNANIRLAQAFHPLLTQFEVILRNSINAQLATYFKDQNWIINQRNGFMKHRSLQKSNYYLYNSVKKSKLKLQHKNTAITSGKIISDQTLGFWTSLFLAHHYRLIQGQPIKIFQHKDSTENRASIFTKLEAIKEFRNRMSHCEPLCFKGEQIDCSQALKIRNKLYDLVSWIDPQLIPFFNKLDNVMNKVDRIHLIKEATFKANIL